MKFWLFLAALAFGAPPPALAQTTPLFMQMDRTQDPSPICANRLSTASGCQSIGTMSSGGVFMPKIPVTGIVKSNGSTPSAAVPNTDYLPVDSAHMTGTPTAPTPSVGNNSTDIATTAFVAAAAQRQTADVTGYGAVGDGDIVHADVNASAIASAIATGRCALIPWAALGFNLGTHTIALHQGQCVIGENQVQIKSTTSSATFTISGVEVVDPPAIIDNLKINMAGAPSGSTAIRYATGSGNVVGGQVSRILCVSVYECVGDEDSDSNYISDVRWFDIRSIAPNGRSFHSYRSRGFMWLDTLRVDYNQDGVLDHAITWDCAAFEDIVGLELRRYDCNGPDPTHGGTTAQTGSMGLRISGVAGDETHTAGEATVFLDRVLIDSTSGSCAAISGVYFLTSSNLQCYGNLGNQLVLSDLLYSNLSNTNIRGAVGITGAATGANGVLCTACSAVNFDNLVSTYNTGNGFVVGGTSSGVSVHNLQVQHNTSNALAFLDSADFVGIDGGLMGFNGGNLLNTTSGAGNRITNMTGYNPLGTHAITPSGSPYHYTTGTSPETICWSGGTVSSIAASTVTQMAQTNVCGYYGPNEEVVTTYSVVPTMTSYVH